MALMSLTKEVGKILYSVATSTERVAVRSSLFQVLAQAIALLLVLLVVLSGVLILLFVILAVK
jgi:hypothetical protein